MKIEPIITEKSMSNAEKGVYTFRVEEKLDKFAIKHLVEQTFGVHVVSVRTMIQKGEKKRGFSKYSKQVPGYKKAIVTLKKEEKIDLFEVKQG